HFTINNYELSIGLSMNLDKKTALTIYHSNLKTISNIYIYNNHQKLTWRELHPHKGFISQGRIPFWFINIIDNDNNIKGDSLPTPNPKPQFWSFLENNTISLIKVRRNAIPNNTISGQHHTLINKLIIPCICPKQPCIKIKHITELKSVWSLKQINSSYELLNNISE